MFFKFFLMFIRQTAVQIGKIVQGCLMNTFITFPGNDWILTAHLKHQENFLELGLASRCPRTAVWPHKTSRVGLPLWASG